MSAQTETGASGRAPDPSLVGGQVTPPAAQALRGASAAPRTLSPALSPAALGSWDSWDSKRAPPPPAPRHLRASIGICDPSPVVFFPSTLLYKAQVLIFRGQLLTRPPPARDASVGGAGRTELWASRWDKADAEEMRACPPDLALWRLSLSLSLSGARGGGLCGEESGR